MKRTPCRVSGSDPWKLVWVVGTALTTCFSQGVKAAEKPLPDGVILISQEDAATGLGCGSSGFPIVICRSGSYRLSGNLTVPASGGGIQIAADNVTLDLNGFGIEGPNTCNGDSRTQTTSCTSIFMFDGVFSERAQITIRNGTIRGMRIGILLTRGPALVEGIHAAQNTGDGVRIEAGVVRRSTAANNGGSGISAFGSDGDSAKGACVVADNLAIGNKNNGIVAAGATVTTNVSNLNRVGIWVWDSSVLQNAVRSSETVGLLTARSLFGGNTFASNPTDVADLGASVSQNNNNCSGTGC